MPSSEIYFNLFIISHVLRIFIGHYLTERFRSLFAQRLTAGVVGGHRRSLGLALLVGEHLVVQEEAAAVAGRVRVEAEAEMKRTRRSFFFRAGHFRYFLIFSIIKNNFLGIFYQVNNLLLHQSYLKNPLPVKLT